MGDGVRGWLRNVGRTILRYEQREVRAFRRWIETTSNLVHLSVLVGLPLVLGLVTALANRIDLLPYLLFPPLASGSYTLFADPESHSASPRRFVGGLTAGAFCGWLALEVTTRFWYGVAPTAYEVSPGAVALGLFLTGAVTWALDLEVPSAFSTALLVHVTGAAQLTYVLSVAASSLLVAGVFVLWRDYVYEERANYLYQSIKGDDHVLVPMGGPHDEATAMLAARLAAAHDAGKVVLLDIVADEDIAEAERSLVSAARDTEASTRTDPVDVGDVSHRWTEREADSAVEAGDVGHGWITDQTDIAEIARERTASASAMTLEAQAQQIEAATDVPCEVVVAVGRGARDQTIGRVARESNCDLIAVPYETEEDRLASYIRDLFAGSTDVIVHRSHDGETDWRRVMVPVRRAGDTAHSMIDFATRLVGSTGTVGVCHCLNEGQSRREAETMLSNLVETFPGAHETRVVRTALERFIDDNDRQYDLFILGASQDRSALSRFISPPTFERLTEVDTDVAIVDRNY